jgi:hypothetical protein
VHATDPTPTLTTPTTTPSTPWLRRVLAVDAAVGTLSGVAVTALSGPLAGELAVGSGIVVTIGLLFVVAGLVNGWAARDGARTPTLLAVDLDVLGAVVSVGVLVLADPSPVGTALLVLTALWTGGIAAVKLVGLRAHGGRRVARR